MEEKVYYPIRDAAAMIGVAPSVLRFWETEFDCLHPVKNKKGTRFYSAHDIELLKRIHYLTRQCGYTLEGAREQMRRRPLEDPTMQLVDNLNQLRSFLVSLKEQL